MSLKPVLTVGELRELLEDVDDDLEVYIQKNYSPLSSEDYLNAFSGDVSVGINEGKGSVIFPANEDIENGVFDERRDDFKDCFLIYP